MAEPRKPIREREMQGVVNRRVRGTILRFVSEQGRRGTARYDALMVMELLRRMQFDVVLTDVIEELKFLERRGYVEFETRQDDVVRRPPEIGSIALTDKGRDLIDGTVSDPSIELD